MPKFLKLILIVFLFFSCSQKPHKDYFGDDFPSHVNDIVLITNGQCLGHDWNQCFELGHFYYQGIKGLPVNQQKAKLLWEESCSHDHQKSCDDYNKFFSSTRVQHQLKELMKEPEKVLELSLVRSNLNEIPKEVFEMINLENLNLVENNIKFTTSLAFFMVGTMLLSTSKRDNFISKFTRT